MTCSKRLVFALSWAVLLSTAASAQQSTWDHNGSSMIMNEIGSDIFISYAEPRSAIRNQGVTMGTVLFRGRMVGGGQLNGTAYTFRDGCEPAGYAVVGLYAPGSGQPRLELYGAAPRREQGGCRIVSYSERSDSAILVFTLIGSDGHSAGDDEGQVEPDFQQPGEGGYDYGAACARAGNAAEQQICRDSNLTRLDAQLNQAYQQLREGLTSADREALKTEQLAWLRERDSCGSNTQCLETAYSDRISYLENNLERH